MKNKVEIVTDEAGSSVRAMAQRALYIRLSKVDSIL
jgi:hypothetical protein